jgi:hypothetical protein
MRKIFKFHLLLLLLLISASTFSQKRTYSPFSRYGVGELNHSGFGQTAAMANTGIAVRTSYHLNRLNPASYSAIDTMSFFFEAGITGFTQSFKANQTKETHNNIDYSYFAMGFPITKTIHSSWGLRPFSNTGYNFEYRSESGLTRAVGTGNLTSAYGGVSFKPTPNLSIGAHGTYLFGNIRHTSFLEFIDDETAYKYGSQSELHTSDFFLDFGMQYTQNFANNQNITLGVTFRPKTAISGNYQKTFAKGSQYAEDGKLFSNNQIIPEVSDTSDIKSFDIPQSIGFGISYNRIEQLILSADYIISNWGSVTIPDGHSSTVDSKHLSAGLQYTPDIRSQNYLSRMRYRAGIKYNEEYIEINNQQINDFGITFGLGLPHNRSKTSINLAFELGKRTQADADHLTENYGKVTINFSFHEFWFGKRKFD